MKFIVVNKIIKYFWIIVSLLCCGCSITNDNKNDIIQNIVSYNKNLNGDFLEYVYDKYGMNTLNSILDAYVNNSYTDEVWHNVTHKSYKVLLDEYNGVYENNNKVKIIDNKDKTVISFVGDISLADNFDIMPYYDSRGNGVYGILDDKAVSIMKSSNIMVANNEFTVSNRGTKLNKLYNFRARPERLKIYDEMGVDIVSIANNHAYDYGEDAFLDTIKYLNEYGISSVGGGSNIEEASSAFYYIANGYKISFLSSSRAEKNIVTPGATETSSGIFRCYDNELLLRRIKEEKEKSDFVILLIHWGKEDSHELEGVQVTTGRQYIDAGADLVIGSHAHVLQGMEIYNNKLIAYNLGDFIFNRETKDTGILSVTINNEGNMNYTFIPCRQSNYKTSLLEGKDKKDVINKMQNYSINVIFNDDGEFK